MLENGVRLSKWVEFGFSGRASLFFSLVGVVVVWIIYVARLIAPSLFAYPNG